MEISAEAIKSVRDVTSAGLMECKRALMEASGSVDGAVGILRERGHEIARKKQDRSADQGVVESYIHSGGRIGVLVEVNCESDFVARTPEFRELAHDLAMQVAAACPRYIDAEDVPDGEEAHSEDCLLLQPFIKDPQKTVRDVIAEAVAKVRENVRVRRFARFELGVDGKDA
jgi:elongation factor Ts